MIHYEYTSRSARYAKNTAAIKQGEPISNSCIQYYEGHAMDVCE